MSSCLVDADRLVEQRTAELEAQLRKERSLRAQEAQLRQQQEQLLQEEQTRRAAAEAERQRLEKAAKAWNSSWCE